MVSPVNPVYLFVGHDIIGPDGASCKDAALEKIRKEFLARATRDFNSDTLYARDFKLKDLQERLLGIPAGSGKRLLVIKDAQLLKEGIRSFILRYVARPHPAIILVLDFTPRDTNDKEELKFIAGLARHARLLRFKEVPAVSAFELSRQIEASQTARALSTLKQLFENGQRPEMVLGGLRSSWQRRALSPAELKKRLRLLLISDIDIKTGRVKPEFVLERLVVCLCSLNKAGH